MDGLTEEEKKALRGSKFAPLPRPSFAQSHPRQAHPGGPLKTNKAAALAKFLERKLQDPTGLASMNPQLLELAVKNAKETIKGGTSSSGRLVQHVNSFGDSEETLQKMDYEPQTHTKKKEDKSKSKKKNKRKKNKRQKVVLPVD